MTITPRGTRDEVHPTDFIGVGALLSEEEKRVRDEVRAFVDETRDPNCRRALGPRRVSVRSSAAAGRVGCRGRDPRARVRRHGHVATSPTGLRYPRSRADRGSLATFLHVQSGLAMAAIHDLGSEEQRRRWLPPMARCEDDRLLRPDRARVRERSRLHDDHGEVRRRRVRPGRGEALDRQRLLRGRRRDLGQGRRRQDLGLPRRGRQPRLPGRSHPPQRGRSAPPGRRTSRSKAAGSRRRTACQGPRDWGLRSPSSRTRATGSAGTASARPSTATRRLWRMPKRGSSSGRPSPPSSSCNRSSSRWSTRSRSPSSSPSTSGG